MSPQRCAHWGSPLPQNRRRARSPGQSPQKQTTTPEEDEEEEETQQAEGEGGTAVLLQSTTEVVNEEEVVIQSQKDAVARASYCYPMPPPGTSARNVDVALINENDETEEGGEDEDVDEMEGEDLEDELQ